jgi:hypothetical protein
MISLLDRRTKSSEEDPFMEEVLARLAGLKSLGSCGAGPGGPALDPDEPFEQDGVPELGIDTP